MGRTGFTTDPTNPDYKYLLTSTGDYAVLYKGLPTTTAKKGTRAHQSIASVLGGGAPLPAAPATPPMKRISLPAEDIRPTPQASPEQYEAKAATETDPVKKKALTDMAARMRTRQPAPAPAPQPAAPAPARKTKQVWDEATGTFKTVEVP